MYFGDTTLLVVHTSSVVSGGLSFKKSSNFSEKGVFLLYHVFRIIKQVLAWSFSSVCHEQTVRTTSVVADSSKCWQEALCECRRHRAEEPIQVIPTKPGRWRSQVALPDARRLSHANFKSVTLLLQLILSLLTSYDHTCKTASFRLYLFPVLCVKADRVPLPWACPYYSRDTSTVTCNRDLLCQWTCQHARHRQFFLFYMFTV